MGSDTNRTFGRFGRIRVLMHSECYCRPEHQHETQQRYAFRDRPHVGYPTNAVILIYTETRNESNESTLPIDLSRPRKSDHRGNRARSPTDHPCFAAPNRSSLFCLDSGFRVSWVGNLNYRHHRIMPSSRGRLLAKHRQNPVSSRIVGNAEVNSREPQTRRVSNRSTSDV